MSWRAEHRVKPVKLHQKEEKNQNYKNKVNQMAHVMYISHWCAKIYSFDAIGSKTNLNAHMYRHWHMSIVRQRTKMKQIVSSTPFSILNYCDTNSMALILIFSLLFNVVHNIKW